MSWIRWFQTAAALACAAVCAMGAEFRTVSGDVYTGEIAAADKDGLILKLETGEYSPRIDWAKWTDDTLRALSEDKRAKRWVEPLLDPPPEIVAGNEARQIAVHQPVRLDLPDTKKGLAAALTSPNGLILLGLLFAANLYGAYEIARFKWRPVALVCGVSAVFPVVGPLVFLLLHRVAPDATVNATQVAAAQTQIAAPPPAAGPSPSSGGAAAAALGVVKTHAAAVSDSSTRVFKRGDSTFNRRFFETQFPSFFRVVATEADKDLVIEVSAGKRSVIANRISRISANEVHFKTPTNQEIGIAFGEISEIKIRHKDAVA